MADLIIKPAATSGNRLILKDQAGGAVLTTADSGATIAGATIINTTGAITTTGALTGTTGDFNWGSNTLVVDSSESKVGIGIVNPGVQFANIAGTGTNVHTNGFLWNGGTASKYCGQFRNGSDPGWGLSVKLGMSAPEPTDHYLDFLDDQGVIQCGFTGTSEADGGLGIQTDGTERMRITSAGKVGIGSSAPNALLDVAGRFQVTASGSSPSGGAGMEIYGGSTPILLTYDRGGSAYLPFKLDGASYDIRTSNTNRMTIDSSGKVGLGTNSPVDLFHVKAGASGQGTPHSYTEFLLESDSHVGINILTPNNMKQQIMFGDPQNVESGAIVYNHSTEKMGFTVGASERMCITSAGHKEYNAVVRGREWQRVTGVTNADTGHYHDFDVTGLVAKQGWVMAQKCHTSGNWDSHLFAIFASHNSSAAIVVREISSYGVDSQTGLKPTLTKPDGDTLRVTFNAGNGAYASNYYVALMTT